MEAQSFSSKNVTSELQTVQHYGSETLISLLALVEETVRCEADVIMLFLHSAMIDCGFHLIRNKSLDNSESLKYDHGTCAGIKNSASITTSCEMREPLATPCTTNLHQRLIKDPNTGVVARTILSPEWNKTTPHYAFSYMHPLWQLRILSHRSFRASDKEVEKHIILTARPNGNSLEVNLKRSQSSEIICALSLATTGAVFGEVLKEPRVNSLLGFVLKNDKLHDVMQKQFFPAALSVIGLGCDTLHGNNEDDSETLSQQCGREIPRLEMNVSYNDTALKSFPGHDVAPVLASPNIDPYGFDVRRTIRPPDSYFRPDGNLIGPNHPGFGNPYPTLGEGGLNPSQRMRGRGMPWHDPIGPLGDITGEPDPDHAPLFGKVPNHMFL